MGRKSRLKRERKLKEQQGQRKSRPEISSDIEKIYLTIIKWGVYFILFIPLIVKKEFIFPFVFPKSTAFQIAVEVIFACWVLLALRNPKARPRFNALGTALALFIAINILASFTGVDFLRSFWSTQERMTGVFALLHLFAFFVILITVFKTSRAWKRLFDLSIVAAVLVSFYALSQKLGITSPIGGSAERLTGTIGNPSFLASWLLFGAFFSLWGVARRTAPLDSSASNGVDTELTRKWKEWVWRLGFYLPSFLFISTILIFTGGRGPFFAYVLGLFLFMLVLAVLRSGLRKLAIVGLLVLIILGAGLFLMRNTSWVKSNPYLNRYASVFSSGELYPTIKGRIIVWDMAFRSWKDGSTWLTTRKFWLGWGPENYNIAFNKYLEPTLGTTDIVWYDRAHNIVLDTVNATGIIGLLSYLGIFVVAIWSLLKLSFNKLVEAKLQFTIPIIILVCYFVQNFFVFDMVNSYIMFFLVLGFISFVHTSSLRLSLSSTEAKPQHRYKPVHWGRIFAAGFLTIILIYVANIRPAQASFYGIKGSVAMLRRNFTKAGEFYKKAFSFNNFTQGEVAKEFSRMIEQTRNNPEFAPYKEETLKLAIRELEKVYKNHPNDVVFPMMLGKLYNLGSQFDTSYLKKAEIVLGEALELSPKRQALYWVAGQNKLLLGEKEGGINLFKIAIYLNPKEDEMGKAFWYLGVALNAAGRYEEALYNLGKAQKLFYRWWDDVPSIMFLAEVNMKAGKPEEALKYYKRALEYAPGNVDIQKKIEELE